jgi:hypothetical protein
VSGEVMWAAGLFEGEGCFSMQRRNRNCRGSLRHVLLSATLSTTDEDVLRRFVAAVGMGRVSGPRLLANKRCKPVWYWSVSGQKVERLYALLEPGLGNRRRARYAELLEERREYEATTHRNGRIRAYAHPNAGGIQ